MKTIIKKGLEVEEHFDGTNTYTPYAIVFDGKKQIKNYVKDFSQIIGYIYDLDAGFYGIKRYSEEEAIDVLNIAVKRFEKREQEKNNKVVIKKYDKEIK